MSYAEDNDQIFPHGTKVYVVNYKTLDITPGIYIPHTQKNLVYSHYVYDLNDSNKVVKHNHCLELERPFRDYVFGTFYEACSALVKEYRSIADECEEKIKRINRGRDNYYSINKENLNIDLDLTRYFIDKDEEYIKTIDESFKKLDVLEEQYRNIVININSGDFKCYDDFCRLFSKRVNRHGKNFLNKYTFVSNRVDQVQIFDNITFMVSSIVYEFEDRRY